MDYPAFHAATFIRRMNGYASGIFAASVASIPATDSPSSERRATAFSRMRANTANSLRSQSGGSWHHSKSPSYTSRQMIASVSLLATCANISSNRLRSCVAESTLLEPHGVAAEHRTAAQHGGIDADVGVVVLSCRAQDAWIGG
jgi:hypothetical protein